MFGDLLMDDIVLEYGLNRKGWWIGWFMGDKCNLWVVNVGVLTIKEGEVENIKGNVGIN